MKKFLQQMSLVLAFLAIPWMMNAQGLLDYDFSTGVDTTMWRTVSSTTSLITATGDGVASSVQQIGFTFPYGDDSYTQFSVNSDGNIRLGGTVTGTSAYTNPFSASNCNTNSPKINFFGCDGYSTSGSHYVYAEVQGTAPNRVLVIDYCTGTYNTDTRSNLYRWQVHLHENGTINVVYNYAPSAAPNVGRQPGLCVNSSDGYVVTPNHAADHFTNGYATNIPWAVGSWPENGRYYTFAPITGACDRPADFAITQLSNTQVSFSWNGTASSYRVYFYPSANMELIDSFDVTNTSYSFSNLTPQTAYTVKVAAFCPDSSLSVPFTKNFTTFCNPLTEFPFSENFDANWSTAAADPIPACWTKGTNYTTAYPYASTTNSHSSNKSLYMYSTSSSYCYLALPYMAPTADSMMVSFWLYKGNTSYPHELKVGAMTDPTNVSTFTEIASVSCSAVSTWEYFEIPLNSYTGGGHYVAFMTPGDAYSYPYLDDVTLDYIPSCFHPVDLTLESVESHQAILSWNDARQTPAWDVEYATSQITPGAGAGTELTVYDTTTVTLTGLDAQTTYYVYVRANCGSGDYSTWESITITTPCEALTLSDLPYTEDFEAYGSGSTSPISPCWTKGTNYSTAYPYPNSSNAITGNRSLYFYGNYPSTSTSTKVYSYAALPPVESTIDVRDLTLSFNARRYNTTTDYYQSYIVVGVMTNPSDISTFDTVQVVDLTNEAGLAIRAVDVNLASYQGSGKYVALYSPVPVLNGTTYASNYIYIDDIELMETPSCPRPDSLRVVSTGAFEATLAWHETGSATSWSIEYGLQGFEEGTGDIATSASTTVTLTGLLPNQNYTAYVHADCGSEMSPARVIDFRTSCVTLTLSDLPYTENFEAYGSGAVNPIDPCWHKGTNNTVAYPYPYSSNAVSGERSLYFYTYRSSTANYYAYAALPEVDASVPLSSLTLGFNARRYSSTSYNYHSLIYIGAMTDPEDISTFDTITLVDLTSEAALSVHNLEIDLASYTGSAHYVAFLSPAIVSANSTDYNYIYIDDVVLMSTPSCRRPSAIDVSYTTAHAASVHWTPGTDAGSYTVEYGPEGFTLGEGEVVTANDTTIVLTGLTYDTPYQVYVSANCGGETSTSISTYFRTGCIEFTIYDLPYTEDFEAYGTGSTNPISPCWHKGTNNSSTAYPYPYATNVINGIRSLYFYVTHSTSSALYAYAALPAVSTDLDISDLTLRFNMRRYATTTAAYHSIAVVGVMGNPNDISTFDTVQVIDLTDQEGLYTTEVMVDFASYQDTGRYIAIYDPSPELVGTTTQYNAFYVDDVTLMRTPNCFHPVDLTINEITDETIALSWTPYNETSRNFIVEYGPQGFELGTGAIEYVTSDTSVTLYSLNSGTTYDIYVRTDCGGEVSDDAMISAYTIAGAPEDNIPYYCDFSDEDMANAWTLVNGDQTNRWMIGHDAFRALPESEDSTALYISNNDSLNSYTLTSKSYVYAFRDFNLQTGEYNLQFDWRCNGESTFDWVRCFLVPNTYFPQAGMLPAGATSSSTFNTVVPDGWMDLGGGKLNLLDPWQHVDTSFSLQEGTYRIIYLWTNDASGGAQHPAAIDNISLERKLCPTPANLRAANLLATTVDIAWDALEANRWKLTYDTVAIITNDSVVSISGLEPNSDYIFTVYALCDADSSSSISLPVHTPCNAIELPWSENFDTITTFTSAATGVQMPCWSFEMTGSSTYQGASYQPQVYYSATNANSGNYSYRLYGESYVLLPLLPTTIDSVSLAFSQYTTGAAYMLELYSVEDTGYHFIKNLTPSETSTHTNEIYYLNNYYQGTSHQLAFRNHNTSATTYYTYTYLDDIAIDYIPSCIPPIEMAVSNVDVYSATIDWEGTAASYEIEYGAAGFTQGQGTTLTTTSTTSTITGLNPNTLYDVYVRSHCSATDISTWVATSFRTNCEVISTLPWTENFDTYTTATTAATGIQPYCWDYVMTGSATYQATSYRPQVYYSTTYATSGNYSLRLYGNSYTMLPEFSASIDSLQLEFWSRSTSTSYILTVGVMEDSVFVPVDTIDYTGTTSSEYHIVYLSNYHGNGNRIAFRNTYTTATTYYSYHYIDDITVSYIPSCLPVQDVTMDSVTKHLVVLDWTDLGTPASWEIEYGPAGYTQGQGTTVSVTSHPATVNGLNASTLYDFYVRPVCSATDTGEWSNAFAVATECDVMSLPYSQNFDNIQGTTYNAEGPIPICWATFTNGTSSAYNPHVISSGSYWFCDSASSFVMTSGSTAMYGTIKVARLPIFDVPVNQQVLSYWMSTESNTYGTFSVGYVTGDDLENDFVAVKVIPASATTYHGTSSGASALGYRDTVAFDSVPADAIAIAFKWEQGSTYYSVCLDDIKVTSALPSCPAPVLATPVVTYESADITWSGSGISYEVALKAQNDAEWGVEIPVSDNTYSFTALQPATTYLYRVRQICDTDFISDWAVGAFTTDSLPCFAPEALAVTATGFQEVSFSWTPGTSETFWTLRVWNSIFDTTYAVSGTPAATATNLVPGSDYYAAVLALCGSTGNIESLSWSDTIAFTTEDCDPVSNVNATYNGISAVITWTPGANNSNAWEVRYGYEGFTNGEQIADLPATTNSLTLTNLEGLRTYDVYVHAVCAEGVNSNWSNKVSFYVDHIGIHVADNDANVAIYPNPASGSTTISLAGIAGQVSLTIVDMNGRTIRTENMECDGNCVKTLDVEGLSQGAYFVRVLADNYSTVKKLIVK